MLAKYWKPILLAVGVLVAFLYLRGCQQDHTPPTAFNSPLPDSSAAQVVVENRHIAVRSATETKVGYVPEAGHATALIDKDGTVHLQIQSAGLTFQPIIGLMFATNLRLAVGAQLGYWNRFEIFGGGAIGYGGGHLAHPCGFAGVGYRLDQLRLTNTSVYVAYTTAQEVAAGWFLRF